MGVPRLRQHLRPYGVESQFVPSSKSETRVHVDGPGLAHFVYWRLYNHQSSTLSVIDAQPSYTQIGDAAVQYLDAVEAHGLHV